ncbi:uncharacterized protein EI97DRAFT_402602 [Westerdykella ornata]|uniref:DUF7053 domain-containing protein n=1 Tax=Westerdykella ornata TaxID=318751 RepID=A0A6A6JDH0_WESOR|nr:uncharacterized protein EI97DRAFT_402602 [Westerdykella ornata]KAF2274223.1 hypothetical protein EI97DRAFT_402602 [Westerdykella ornata]
MSKTSVFTSITPLPAGVTRQSVIETYHNHEEMIDLNPLVIERFQCKPPSYAPAEEYYSTWYTIKDKISYLPGGLATGSVSYHACFHDLPDGLQTHIYAPLGLDIRAKWSVGGSLPGEPKEPVELGLGAPREGLYIREDVKMKCNLVMISFVKKTFKESHSKLVDRLVEKAHMMDAKVANERLNALKTVDPRERSGHGEILIGPPPGYGSLPPQQSLSSVYSHARGNSYSSSSSPNLSQSSQSPYRAALQGHAPEPGRAYRPHADYHSAHGQIAESAGQGHETATELPGTESERKRVFAAELPG